MIRRLGWLLELSDGSKRLIPADWIDRGGDSAEGTVDVAEAAGTLGSGGGIC